MTINQATTGNVRRDKNRVQSVQRAFAVLEAFSHSEPWVGITILARRTGLSKGVVFRLVQTMLEAGYLEQDPSSGMYRVGLRAFELGSQYLPHAAIERAALDPMRYLAAQHQYNVYVGSLVGMQVVYLATVDGGGPIEVRARVGSRAPAHATALGKALLAALDPQAARALIAREPLIRLTDRTITDIAVLEAQLTQVRARGYAVNMGETHPVVGSIAAPIADRFGTVVAAVSNGFPLQLESKDSIRKMAVDVIACATDISTAMGASRHLPRSALTNSSAISVASTPSGRRAKRLTAADDVQSNLDGRS